MEKLEKLEKVVKEIVQKKSELKTDEERTAFLLELVEKYNLSFCYNSGDTLHFKDPSDCSRCFEGQIVMKGIFGNYGGLFTALPYVTYLGDREYAVDLRLASKLAKGGKKAIEAEKERMAQEEAAKEAAKKEAEEKAVRESLTKKFGKGLTSVVGLLEHLVSATESQSSGSCSLVDIEVKPREGVVASLYDEHWWSNGGGGIGMASVIEVYRDGKEESFKMTYRDQYSADGDNWSNSFGKIKIKEITPTKVTVVVIPTSKEYPPREFTFNLRKKRKKNK